MTVEASSAHAPTRRALVGFDGGFTFEKLTPGAWLVQARYRERSKFETVALGDASDQASVTLRFEAGHRLAGQVVRQGRPLGGVRVEAVCDASHRRTTGDAVGRFTFDDVPGGSCLVTASSADSGVRAEERVDVSGATDVLLEVSGYRLVGRVVAAFGGAPIPDVVLRARGAATVSGHGPNASQVARSGADGLFAFEVSTAGPFRIEAAKAGFGTVERHASAVHDAESPRELEVVMRPAEPAKLLVSGPWGEVPATVTVHASSGDGGVTVVERHRPDIDGRVVLEGLGEGQWSLTVVGAGQRAQARILVPGPPVAIDLGGASRPTAAADPLPEASGDAAHRRR